MANDYTTTAAVQSALPSNTWSTSYAALLTKLITRASRLIDSYYPAREPGSFAVGETDIRYFDGSGTPRLLVDELAAAPSAVAVAETGVPDNASGGGGTYTTWYSSDYFLWPRNALSKKQPILALDINVWGSGGKSIWYAYPQSVKITGYWGYATTSNTPDLIVQACEAQTVRMFHEFQQKYADVGAIPDLNQLHYAKNLHPEVKMILDAAEFQQLGGLF